jgi:preprotein translocase subunit SecY
LNGGTVLNKGEGGGLTVKDDAIDTKGLGSNILIVVVAGRHSQFVGAAYSQGKSQNTLLLDLNIYEEELGRIYLSLRSPLVYKYFLVSLFFLVMFYIKHAQCFLFGNQ